MNCRLNLLLQRLMELNVGVRKLDVVRDNYVMFTAVADRMLSNGRMK